MKICRRNQGFSFLIFVKELATVSRCIWDARKVHHCSKTDARKVHHCSKTDACSTTKQLSVMSVSYIVIGF